MRNQNAERRRQKAAITICVLLPAFCLLLTACALVEDVPPVADAGQDQTVKLGTPLTLDASRSREIDGGTIVEYRWTIIGVPNYERYRAHLAEHHPEREPLTEDAFVEERLTARYSTPGNRCC